MDHLVGWLCAGSQVDRSTGPKPVPLAFTHGNPYSTSSGANLASQSGCALCDDNRGATNDCAVTRHYRHTSRNWSWSLSARG